MDEYEWVYEDTAVDWDALSELYRLAPLGEKSPRDLATVFANSRFTCFVYAGDRVVGVGRALADGLDCSYTADVAVHPDHQGKGLGTAVIAKLGFYPMNTAMAIWRDTESAIASGLLRPMP